MTELRNKLEKQRQELNKMYAAQGLNDFTLKKSQELDELIAIIQKLELQKLMKNNVIA